MERGWLSHRKTRPGGIGSVLRYDGGAVKGLFTCYVGIGDSNLAEVVAIRKALEISNSNSHIKEAHLIIESDSSNAIKWINELEKRSWSFTAEFRFIDKLRQERSTQPIFIHTMREVNHFADNLAKQGTNIGAVISSHGVD